MMHVTNYGTAFVLLQDERILSEAEAVTIFQGAFERINVVSPMLGVSFDGTHLMPSIGGMGQSHLKCEFTLTIKAQAEITSLSKAKAQARKAVAKLRKAYRGNADGLAVAYVTMFGTLKIEGEGARATNYGVGYTLTVNSGDTAEARKMVEKLTKIRNKDSRNDKAMEQLHLTMEAEVTDVMLACGFGEMFLEILENVQPLQTITKSLAEAETEATMAA